MSKELEALEIIGKLYLINDEQVKDWDKRDFNILKSALQRLESIENVSPSEALKFFVNMQGRIARYISTIEYTTIKQALLKSQEPKKYLKWEDLEFGKTTHKLKAKMNGNLYRIEWYIDGMGSKVVCLDKYITNDYLIHSVCIKDYNQQFFNDLHLERVEE
jgi:hypothetical protein